MEFGFIGFGRMAKMLIHGLIEYSKVAPHDICVTRHDKSRLNEITDAFNGVTAFEICSDVAKHSRIVFLCVKPAEIKGVLLEIAPYIASSTHIISLAGTVSIDNLQTIAHGKISKLIPTITSEIGKGIALLCHNEHVTEEDASYIKNKLCPFGEIKLVKDEDIGFAAELTSCAPGFIASIFSHFSNMALKHTTSFTGEEIAQMVTHTLYATSTLLHDTEITFEQLISRVATKGGITQEGVSIFDTSLPSVFDNVFETTLKKRKLTETQISEAFQNI